MKFHALEMCLHLWYVVTFWRLRIHLISLLLSILLVCWRHRMKHSLNILEDLDCSDVSSDHANLSDKGRLSGYFCSSIIFNLSKGILLESEIKILENGLDYVRIQRKINEPDLRTNFEEFSRRMQIKWRFKNETSEGFSEITSLRPKSSWKPPKGNPNLEMFLSKVE